MSSRAGLQVRDICASFATCCGFQYLAIPSAFHAKRHWAYSGIRPRDLAGRPRRTWDPGEDLRRSLSGQRSLPRSHGRGLARFCSEVVRLIGFRHRRGRGEADGHSPHVRPGLVGRSLNERPHDHGRFGCRRCSRRARRLGPSSRRSAQRPVVQVAGARTKGHQVTLTWRGLPEPRQVLASLGSIRAACASWPSKTAMKEKPVSVYEDRGLVSA